MDIDFELLALTTHHSDDCPATCMNPRHTGICSPGESIDVLWDYYTEPKVGDRCKVAWPAMKDAYTGEILEVRFDDEKNATTVLVRYDEAEPDGQRPPYEEKVSDLLEPHNEPTWITAQLQRDHQDEWVLVGADDRVARRVTFLGPDRLRFDDSEHDQPWRKELSEGDAVDPSPRPAPNAVYWANPQELFRGALKCALESLEERGIELSAEQRKQSAAAMENVEKYFVQLMMQLRARSPDDYAVEEKVVEWAFNAAAKKYGDSDTVMLRSLTTASCVETRVNPDPSLDVQGQAVSAASLKRQLEEDPSEGAAPEKLRKEGSGPDEAPSAPAINSPGHWDAMISYTQRNPVSEALAYKLFFAFAKRGMSVWLDVEMAKRDEAAMEEGVKNSRCVIAIVSGPQEGKGSETAYLKREFCLKELRWAVDAGVPVQPIVVAEDKGKITEFFADIPADLQQLKSANWEHVDRKDSDYFELGVTKIIRATLGESE